MIDLFAFMGVGVLLCLLFLVVGWLPLMLIRKAIFRYSKGGKILNHILCEIKLDSRKGSGLRYGRTENFSWHYQSTHLFSRKLALRDGQGNMINAEFSWEGFGYCVFMSSEWKDLSQWQANLLAKTLWNKFRNQEIHC